MSDSKGMLLAAPERWDEACFSVAAVRALERSGVLGGLVCREDQDLFWATVSSLPRFTFTQKTRASALLDEIGGGWEAALVWEEGLAAKVFSKAKIARRLGPDGGKLSRRLTHPMSVNEGATEHRVRMYLKTCEQMGVAVDRAEYFSPADLRVVQEGGTVLLCPDSDYGASYEWPLERWQQVAEALLEKGKKVTVTESTGGRRLGEDLAGRLGEAVEFLPSSPLGAALNLLAAYELVISADGSLPHLAAHAGAICVTLFGPNDAVWKRPLGKRHVVVKRHVECAPCLSPKCLMDMRCQNELEVGRVLAAIPT